MALTRRRFLTHLATAGSASLAYEAMMGLGLLAAPAQARFELAGRVSNVRVLVLGGGLAGLTTAYELGKVGYDCRVLEARARPGGRVFTVRRGTMSEEEGSTQTAAFDEGLYFNAGPMRISHHHHTTLAYCKELQVPVEVFVADSESAYLSTRSAAMNGRRVRLREARADFDGYIAELLGKSLSQAQLDQALTTEDRDRLMAYLRRLGALDQQRTYRGSPRRSGYEQRSEPLPLRDLLGANFDFALGIDWDSQPAMMQVVGGMDRLPAALATRLGNRVVYRAAVREIRQNERGVWVVYADANGQLKRADADYLVTTIPLPVLNEIQKDLSPPVQSAIAASNYDGAGKIGLQFKRRFWEEDDEIYGGRSWTTDHEIGQIIYPSHGFNSRKGVLIGYYLDFQRTMRARLPAERQRLALEQGARVHPQYVTEFESAFSVSWPRVPWNRGSWRSEAPAALTALAALQQPDGRVHFAGDYMTNQSSWMNGAFESARTVAMALHARAPARP
jgi:monoamine oxidase